MKKLLALTTVLLASTTAWSMDFNSCGSIVDKHDRNNCLIEKSDMMQEVLLHIEMPEATSNVSLSFKVFNLTTNKYDLRISNILSNENSITVPMALSPGSYQVIVDGIGIRNANFQITIESQASEFLVKMDKSMFGERWGKTKLDNLELLTGSRLVKAIKIK